MANVVYVGNYPCTLSDEEILEVFQDFEGLVLLRSVKKNQKCYSFILCQDQDQVVDVVFALNGFNVGGRKLIVRASDDDLQEIIDQCEYEDDYLNYDGGDDTLSITGSTSFSENNSVLPSSQTRYRQPRKPSRLAAGSSNYRGENDSVLDPSSEASRCETSFSCYSSRKTGSLSPCSSVASSTRRKQRGEKFSFVTVLNFPDDTTTEELHEMFEDYNPFKIIIQNQITDDNKPTEAVICFMRGKDATSAILNLDNTLYQGKVILVTECDDVSLILDLMKVHNG